MCRTLPRPQFGKWIGRWWIWKVDLEGQPQVAWRGVRGDASDRAAVVTGCALVLLPRQDLDGGTRLVPHNLISAWYWVAGGATPRPVRQVDLKRAFLADGGYHPDLIAGLDSNRNGSLDRDERALDTPEKTSVAQRRLEAVGVKEPRVAGEIQPLATHHGVGPAKGATRDCRICHRADSRLGEPMLLASRVPGGVLPELVGDSGVELQGSVTRENQTLVFRPSTAGAGLAAALKDLAAECVAVPALAGDYLRRGHAVYFRCHAAEAAQLRIDVMSIMRGVASFPAWWERRTTLADLEGETWDVMNIEDLVRAKKTQRDKDWPMIRTLVEAHFARHHAQPQPSDVRFWLREARSPEILCQCAAMYPDLCAAVSAERPLLSLVTTEPEDDLPLERALMEEELAERLRDREYWRPLRAELERSRHQLG